MDEQTDLVRNERENRGNVAATPTQNFGGRNGAILHEFCCCDGFFGMLELCM
jgi:hypothetical protein